MTSKEKGNILMLLACLQDIAERSDVERLREITKKMEAILVKKNLKKEI